MFRAHPKDLLFSPETDDEKVADLLGSVGIKEIKKADTNLQLIGDEPRSRFLLAEMIEVLLDSLSGSPDPDQALNYFERFSRVTLNKVNLLSYLKDSPYTVSLLIKVFGSSPFMAEVLIRYPHYLYWISESRTLQEKRSKNTLTREISNSLKNLKTKQKQIEMLCIFKHKELLRIGVRDLLKKASVEETTSALSDLAEVIIGQVLRISSAALKKRYGLPLLKRSPRGKMRTGFTILAMGKLGGGELNFCSDVDLLYLHASDRGKTSGIHSVGKTSIILNAEYFMRLSQEITTTLSGMTNKGSLYRVDLRLRPEGSAGEITCSLKRYQEYYAKRGETWEKLALLKAWPAAGDRRLGKKFLETVSRFIYRRPFSSENMEEIKTIKEGINRKIEARGKNHLNVKLGIGGIREVEFIVQALQMVYGKNDPQIRERRTLRALRKLYRKKILSPETFRHLTDGYLFLRDVENKLQMVDERQTHSLPENPDALQICALRLQYRDEKNRTAAEHFLKDFRFHTEKIHYLFRDFFYSPDKSSFLFPKRLIKN